MKTHTGKLVAFVALLLVLAGCSGNKIVPTYGGTKLPKEQVAVLTAGENISVLEVNGEPVPKYLLSNIEVKYGLKPGPNRILFQYRSVWANHQRDEDGPRAVEVSSAPREVNVLANAGDTLYFDYASAGNVREARALAENFKARVRNARGDVVAESQMPVPEEEQVAISPGPDESAGESGLMGAEGAVLVTPQSLAATRAAPAASAPTGALPALEGLKVLWNQASNDEKKAFLKWAFQ